MHIVYGSSSDFSERVSSRYLEINGVGSTLEERRDLLIDRPNGRCDYGLLYIDRGSIEFDLGNGFEAIDEGTFLLFRPGEPHKSLIWKESDSNHYWIYFSGTAVDRILEDLSLSSVQVIKTSKDQRVIDIYERIFYELLYRTPGFLEAINSMIIELLTYAARHGGLIGKADKSRAFVANASNELQNALNPPECIVVGTMWDERISNAMREIQINLEHFYTVDELAEICHLSKYYFCRLFTKIVGIAPHRYILLLKLNKARDMLAYSDITIVEVAARLGFSDVAVLRRAFIREYGVSPSEFREKSKKSTV